MATNYATRPLAHLERLGRDFPGAWHGVDHFRKGRGVDLPKWPAWCFLPMAAWTAIVTRGDLAGNAEQLPDMPRAAAVGTWAFTKGVYVFNEDLRAALVDAPLNGDLPAEHLLRLPEWCVYIATPGAEYAGQALHGFFAHLEWDANDHRQELRLLLDTEDGLLAQILHIGPWPLVEALGRVAAESERQLGASLPNLYKANMGRHAAYLQPLLSMVLYICSDEPEIEDREEPAARPGRPKPKRVKGEWRLFHAKRPRLWRIGEQIGRQVREALDDHAQKDQKAVERRTVRPHIRRAHWHGWWKGARESEDRRYYQKFLPPIVVMGSVPDAE